MMGMLSMHFCGSKPCDICGAGYAPGVFRVEKGVGYVGPPSVPLSDADIDRIADRVVQKLKAQRYADG